MPKIFSDAQKEKLYELLKQNCVILVKQHGYKGFNIRTLAKMTGISPGTYYHFFSSKEELVSALIKDSQDSLQSRYMELYRLNGHIKRTDFVHFFYQFFVEEPDNILRFLSRDDITTLLLRSDRDPFPEAVKSSMLQNTELLDNPRGSINLNAVLNFTQLINLCLENRDLLVQAELNNTIKKLLENIADEIFEDE